MRRPAALGLAGLAAIAVTAPAEARMSRAVLMSDSPAMMADAPDDDAAGWMPVAGQPSLIERILEGFRRAPSKDAVQQKNDITATLEAMQLARIGFSDSRPRRCGIAGLPTR